MRFIYCISILNMILDIILIELQYLNSIKHRAQYYAAVMIFRVWAFHVYIIYFVMFGNTNQVIYYLCTMICAYDHSALQIVKKMPTRSL